MKNQDELRIVVGELEGQLCRVEIWIGNERLTEEDALVYQQAFLYAMQKSVEHLKAELNFFRHEEELSGLGLEDAFEFVSTGNLHSLLRIFVGGLLQTIAFASFFLFKESCGSHGENPDQVKSGSFASCHMNSFPKFRQQFRSLKTLLYASIATADTGQNKTFGCMPGQPSFNTVSDRRLGGQVRYGV